MAFLESLASARAASKALTSGPGWLKAMREKAWEQAIIAGLPTTRHESFRYTSLRPLAALANGPGTPDYLPAQAPWEFLSEEAANKLRDLLDPAGLNLVFVDGVFVHELSGAGPDVQVFPGAPDMNQCVHVEGLREALQNHSAEAVKSLLETIAKARQGLPVPVAHVAKQEQTLELVEDAFLNEGVLIHFSDDFVAPAPIRLIHVHAHSQAHSQAHAPASAQQPRPTAGFTRHLIHVGQNTTARISECYLDAIHPQAINESETKANPRNVFFAGTTIVMEKNSILRHDRILSAASDLHFGNTNVVVAGGARYLSLALNLSANLGRHNITAMIEGEGAEVVLDGLTTAQGEQLLDTQSIVDHRAPHTTSRQLYKSILKDKSRSVFSGKIFVRKGAQKTAAFQQTKTLLLSNDAEVDAKPQLEIEADDVRCSHGATVTQLNHDEMFYLRSRGIPESTAEAMLSQAFAGEILRTADDPWLEALARKELTRFFQ